MLNAFRRILQMINNHFEISMEPVVESNSSANNQDDALVPPRDNEITETTIDTIEGLGEHQPLDISHDSVTHVGSVHVLRHPQVGYVANQQTHTREGTIEFPLCSVTSTTACRIAAPNDILAGNATDADDKQLAPSESRLNAILCCTVCIDLPVANCYQCSNGHLMCEVCINRILADAHLEDKIARCPSCRCEMSDDVPYVRNLAVEKAVSELPISCQFCQEQYPRHHQLPHLVNCRLKPVPCRYASIGCTWEGPAHELTLHQESCAQSALSGEQVTKRIEERDTKDAQNLDNFDIFHILSHGDVLFADLRLKSYFTDSVNPRLYYESYRFPAVTKHWVVRAKVISNDTDQIDPLRAVSRSIVFQLVLKNRSFAPISTHFVAIGGPNCDVNIRSRIHKFEFTADKMSTDYLSLQVSPEECDFMTSTSYMYFRLIIARPIQ